MDRRIAPPGDKELKLALDDLTSTPPGRNFTLFETKQKALMFAAALGKYRGLRQPVESRDTGAAIRFDIFQKAMDDGFLSALAVETEGDLKVLSEEREDEIATLFEEHAHCGLQEINRLCFQTGSDPLDVLLNLVSEARDSEGEDEIPAGVDAAVFRNLLG